MIDNVINVVKSDMPVPHILNKTRLIQDAPDKIETNQNTHEFDWLHDELVAEQEAIREQPVEKPLNYMDMLWALAYGNTQTSSSETGEQHPVSSSPNPSPSPAAITTIIEPLLLADEPLQQDAIPEPVEKLPMQIQDTQSEPPQEPTPDISIMETVRYRYEPSHTSQSMPQLDMLYYRGVLLLKKPLAAIEIAIMNHIEKRGSTPSSLYMSSSHKELLQQAHIRIKHTDFQDVYYYFSGVSIEAIKIYYENEMPEWMMIALNGQIDRDIIYSAV